MVGLKLLKTSKFAYAVLCLMLLLVLPVTLFAEQDSITKKQSLDEQRAALKQRKQSLKLQYQKLQKTLAEEDAFSPNLAETYFSYGLLLQQDGQYEEAVEALKNAAHIKKVNSGIYSSEQLPALKAKFEVQRILDDEEAYEETIKQILFVESKNPKEDKDISYDLLIDLGHDYFNDYRRKPYDLQRKRDDLLSAKYYLTQALNKYHKKVGIKTKDLPYGELAMISFQLRALGPPPTELAESYDTTNLSVQGFQARQFMTVQSYSLDMYKQGLTWLEHYLSKAKKQGDDVQIVNAYIAIADYSLLSSRGNAFEYYQQAWEKAQSIGSDQTVSINLDKPVPLPNFDYLKPLPEIINPKYTLFEVPVKLTISPNGKVIGVKQVVMNGELADNFKKAKSIVRRITFRPKIINGKAVKTENFEHQVKVYRLTLKD